MLGRLILLMTVVPAIELYLLIQIGKAIGGWETVGLVIITGILGASLFRREGLSVLRKIQEDTLNGIPPTAALTEGLLVLVGGILLITPGVVTDVIGLLSIFPLTRKLIAPALTKGLSDRVQVMDGVHIGAPVPGPAATRVQDQLLYLDSLKHS